MATGTDFLRAADGDHACRCQDVDRSPSRSPCLAYGFLEQGEAPVPDAFRSFMSALRAKRDYEAAWREAFGRLDVTALDQAFRAAIR